MYTEEENLRHNEQKQALGRRRSQYTASDSDTSTPGSFHGFDNVDFHK